jgi:REP element-mobilizing transposase RayT
MWGNEGHVQRARTGGGIKMSTGIYNQYTGYHNRRSIRLRGYDYSEPGYYFITMCIDDRKQKLFGDVVDGKMVLNEMGAIVENELLITEKMRPNIKIDEYIIMPNHVHIVINIRRGTLPRAQNTDGPRAQNTDGHETKWGTWQRAPTEIGRDGDGMGLKTVPTEPKIEQFGKPTSNSIPTIVRLIKSTTTKQINLLRHFPGKPVWQRDYYEHVVRNETSLFLIRKYVRENPVRWECDAENHIDREIDEYGK